MGKSFDNNQEEYRNYLNRPRNENVQNDNILHQPRVCFIDSQDDEFYDAMGESEEQKISKFTGVSYCAINKRWNACRWSADRSELDFNGEFEDEISAARASDALAKTLRDCGERIHKLNFPEDEIEAKEVEESVNFSKDMKKRKNPSSAHLDSSICRMCKKQDANNSYKLCENCMID